MTHTKHTAIAIIGAGPVGLMLANLLGKLGLIVHVVDERVEPLHDSMAIGITPSSLKILNTLELDQSFIERGIPVTTVRVFENGIQLGDVDFSSIPAEYRCMLSLPQSETTAILRENLNAFPSVRLEAGRRFVAMHQRKNSVNYRLQNVETNTIIEHSTAYLVGCDGHRSTVRKGAGIRFAGGSYRPHFCMADFDDHTGWGSEARLFFGCEGAVESFPLPGNRRRWIVQGTGKSLSEGGCKAAAVAAKVQQRTGITLSVDTSHFCSHFQPQRYLADDYTCDRVLLCGDAAHVMSPIGGQGMNTGFSDANQLAAIIPDLLAAPQQARNLLETYTRSRQRAFGLAARRAAYGMWLGTRTGKYASFVRRLLMTHVLLRPPVRERLASCFSMLSTPANEVSNVT